MSDENEGFEYYRLLALSALNNILYLYEYMESPARDIMLELSLDLLDEIGPKLKEAYLVDRRTNR